ncbi:MAG: glutathione S-transferase family protein [Pseudomonadota bacterium]
MVLFGYGYSVYTRTVLMVLHIKSAAYTFKDIDPFEIDTQDALRTLHPFGRVPVLHSDGFEIYETQAILDFLEAATPSPPLQPAHAQPLGRMRQVMSIADSYFYWPLVRQAASQHVFHPAMGDPVDHSVLRQGVEAAPPVLDALEVISAEGLVLVTGAITLADCHLWPMMEYALMVPDLAAMVAQRPGLAAWAEAMSTHPAARATAPDMAALRDG